ncbi:MAG: hypothetical protein ABH823_02875 [bacterium]
MKLIVAILCFCLVGPAAWAIDPTVYTDDSSVIGGGARPLGMGRAFVAIVDDADAPLINPAGNASLKTPQLITMFTNLMGEIYYAEYCTAIPTKLGVIGAAYVNTGTSHVEIDLADDLIVYADYHDTLFILSYSSPLARFVNIGRNVFVGLNLKYFSRGWTGGYSNTATGLSADFGVKYVVTPYLSLGFNRQNFLPVDFGGVVRSTSGAEESIAGLYKVGVAIKPFHFKRKLLLAYDVDLPSQSGRPVTSHIGAEYKATQAFMVRAGFDQSIDAASATRVTWNPSVGLSITMKRFRLDYAYHAYYNDPNLATYYLSLSFMASDENILEGEVY